MSDDDLSDLPLDAFDRFLLRRLGRATKTVDELPVLAPYERSDIMLRIDYLLRLGVLEAVGGSPHDKRETQPVFGDAVTQQRPQLRRRQEPTPLEHAVIKKVSVANE